MRYLIGYLSGLGSFALFLAALCAHLKHVDWHYVLMLAGMGVGFFGLAIWNHDGVRDSIDA